MFYDVFYNFGNLSVFLLLERLFSPGARLWPPCGLRRLCGHRDLCAQAITVLVNVLPNTCVYTVRWWFVLL